MSDQNKGLDFTLPPRKVGEPTTQWLRDALRSAIVRGVVRRGGKIPSSRELARMYGVARGTAVTAVDDLRAEGYLQAIRGSGVYASRLLPNKLLEARSSTPNSSPASGERAILSEFGKRVGTYPRHSTMGTKAFRTNLPALDRFPSSLWARTMSSSLRRVTASQLYPSDPGGYEGLRCTIADYLTSSRGAVCSPEQVVIVSGVREAVDLTARLLLNRGDRVLVEDPGYPAVYRTLEANGARLIPMPLDAEGASPLPIGSNRPRLLYVTPGHQFPTGITMSAARRLEILSYAAKADAYIFEDDYDSEYRYQGRPLPVLQGLDQSGRVILAGSFNKTMFLALRLGYMVLPRPLVNPFLRLRALSQIQSVADQIAFCEFLRDGHFGRHLRQMRRLYASRYEMLSRSFRIHMNDFATLSPIQAGLQTVAWLGQGLSAEAVAAAAEKRNIDLIPVGRYSLHLKIPEGLQLGFAAVEEEEIEHGVKTLASIVRRQRKRSDITKA